MITLTSPPIEHGRYRPIFGIYKRIATPTWEDTKKVLTQDFGQNLLDIYKDMGMLGHNGIDLRTYTGDNILAMHNGTVVHSYFHSGGGWWVWLLDESKTFMTCYMHNKDNLVLKGDKVVARQPIAISNSTGNSTGSHCHAGLYETDGYGAIINKDNSYGGAIPIFDNPQVTLLDMSQEFLTVEEVEKMYVLFGLGLGDQEAINYHTGRKLDDVLDDRLSDLGKELKKV